MPAMSAPKASAFSFRWADASSADRNSRRRAATAPVNRGCCVSRINRRYSSTPSIRIDRPPTAAYQESQAKDGGEGVFTLLGSRFSVRVQVRFGARGSWFGALGWGVGGVCCGGRRGGFGVGGRGRGHGGEVWNPNLP